MTKKATRPNSFIHLESIKEEKASKKGISEEEQALYSMSNTKGWKYFNKTAEDLIRELDSFNDKAVQNGMSYEELGKNAVVISLAKNIIQRLLNKVYDARESAGE